MAREMIDSFSNAWGKINSYNLNEVSDLILTGKSIEKATANFAIVNTIPKNQNMNVLDFGCGFGRNSFGWAKKFSQWHVTGYDHPDMIANTSKYYEIHYEDTYPNNINFMTDWKLVSEQKFDYIICSLVLQHIMEEPLKEYLQCFKNMTNTLIVSGRRFNDDEKQRSTWEILEECGYYPDKFYGYNHQLIAYDKYGEKEDHNTAIYNVERN